jgi:hypothetical protein
MICYLVRMQKTLTNFKIHFLLFHLNLTHGLGVKTVYFVASQQKVKD